MDKESIFELQLIDKNCNDCKFMIRNMEKAKERKQRRKLTGKADNYAYGDCSKLNKEVFFSANTCMPENEDCFIHRKLNP